MKKISNLFHLFIVCCLSGCLMSPAPTGHNGLYGYGNIYYEIDCGCNDVFINLQTSSFSKEYFLIDSTYYGTVNIRDTKGIIKTNKTYYISDSNKIHIRAESLNDTLHFRLRCNNNSINLSSIQSTIHLQDENEAVVKKSEYKTYFEEKILNNLCIKN